MIAPGNPTPKSILDNYPKWRLEFFEDWRIGVPAKPDDYPPVWAKCKICKNSHYYYGNANAFTNFGRHCTRRHNEEYKAFLGRSKKGGSGGGKQSTLTQYQGVITTMTATRQAQLSAALTMLFTDDLFPLNSLERVSFRYFITVSLSNFLKLLLFLNFKSSSCF